MKSLLTAFFALVLSITAFAQTKPEFPELKVKEDYAKAEPLFQQVTVWLAETPLDEQLDLRKQSSSFVMKWIMGSPTVNVAVGKFHMDLMENNIQLFTIFMATDASFCISNKENTDTLAPAKAGLLAVVKVYKKGVGVKKNKTLDQLVKAADADKLEEYIAKNFKN